MKKLKLITLLYECFICQVNIFFSFKIIFIFNKQLKKCVGASNKKDLSLKMLRDIWEFVSNGISIEYFYV